MNIRSSYCFLVSMALIPPARPTRRCEQLRNTNRSTLVLVLNQPRSCSRAGAGAKSVVQQQDLYLITRGGWGCVDAADDQGIGARKHLLHRGILQLEWLHGQDALGH